MTNATNEGRTETRYGLASRLRGFRSTSLMVRIVGTPAPGLVQVVTADLLDVGTPLTLDAAQVAPEAAETVVSHRSGLVVFA